MIYIGFGEIIATILGYHFQNLQNEKKKTFFMFLNFFLDLAYLFIYFGPYPEIKNMMFSHNEKDILIRFFCLALPILFWNFFLIYKFLYVCWKYPRIFSLYLILIILYLKTNHPYLKYFNIVV